MLKSYIIGQTKMKRVYYLFNSSEVWEGWVWLL